MIVCGWNFARGPFDRHPRQDDEFEPFVAAVDYATNVLGADVWLLSHANGFAPPPAPFVLKPGRDFTVVEHLHRLLQSTSAAPFVSLLRGPFFPRETKAIIGQCDMLVAGRVHGAVAGLSQHVPTVIIDYGHEPRAHKLQGIARTAGVEDCVVAPSGDELVSKIDWCAGHRAELQARLARTIPAVKAQARGNFDLLPAVVGRFMATRVP
jgi:colanic acid/amylovoran biosynthesis protein